MTQNLSTGNQIMFDDHCLRGIMKWRANLAVAVREIAARVRELCADARLARQRHSQGKTTHARDLLVPACDCTADLKEAKALLEELS